MVNTLIVCFGDFLNIESIWANATIIQIIMKYLPNFIVSSLKIFTSLFGKCFIVM